MPPKPLNFAAAVTPKASPKTSPTEAPAAGASVTKPQQAKQEIPVEANTETKQENDAPQTKALVDKGLDNEHPLETMWTFHYDKKVARTETAEKGDLKSYENNLKKIRAFTTLEGFWRCYSWLRKPADIKPGHNLFMFRKNLVPAWETFPKGGAWIIKVRKKNGVIGRLWEELLFACVGELFEEPDVVGVVLSSRSSQDLLSVWNSDNTNGDVRFRIGDRLRDILNLDESTQVEYKSFQSAISDGSSFRNAATYVYAAAAAGATE